MQTGRFERGETISLIYERSTPSRVELIIPVTVLEDCSDYTIASAMAGTPIKALLTVNGDIPPRDIPYRELARIPRVLGNSIWTKTNVLFIWRPEWCWDVRLCWDADSGVFQCWYLNVQDPVRRTIGSVTSTDHFLDLVVRPDRHVQVKDDDELDDAYSLGLYSVDEVRQIREAAQHAESLVHAWEWPFNAGYEDIRFQCGCP